MPARDLLTQLEIKKPCSADWDQMTGNSRIRFCEHCQLSVNDLSSLTLKRVRRLIAKSKGQLCVRYHRDPAGNPILAQVPEKLNRIGKRVSRVAAGMFTATLGLSNASGNAATSTQAYQEVFVPVQIQSAAVQAPMGATLSGILSDSSGVPISGAGVTLLTVDRTFFSGTMTDDSGKFAFEGLLPGRYWLRIEAFGYKTPGLVPAAVAENESLTINHTLESETESSESRFIFATTGAVSIVREPAEPLISAAIADDLQALEAVLTRDNVNVRDKNLGTTALEYAVRNGNREMVQILLSAGADVNILDDSKQTVLMMLGEDATVEIVWDLINGGAKVNLQDEEGDSALIEAARQRNLPVLTALVHAGAKVDAKNNEGQTALMLAAEEDQLANIRALIRAGADLNAQDNDGWTALDYAYHSDRERIIKLLLSFGAITGRRNEK